MSAPKTSAWTRVAFLAPGVALFAIHASLYRDWLVDDSGISIAYAVHLAEGHGLVSQPGVAPVEGYSNPLWVFLLAAISRAGLLVLPLAPKLASGVFVTAAFATLLAFVDRLAAHPRLVGACVLMACSLNPAFVIWCTSGLENALYAWTVVTLAYLTVRAVESPIRGRAFVACGVGAALAAMTRPDGVVFAFVPPICALASGQRERRPYALYAVALFGLLGGFVISRIVVFGHLVPNTAIVKGVPKLGDAIDFLLLTRDGIDKMDSVLEAAFPAPIANVVLIGTVSAAVLAARKGRVGIALGVLLAFAAAALVDYMLLPSDWMWENRFGTAFLPLCYGSVFLLIDVALDMSPVRRKAAAFAVVAGSLLSAGLPSFAGRDLVFASGSNISLFFVRSAFAERFDRYADALHVAHPSVLLPDVGAMLLWSHAHVYDLAGLCDASIARLRKADPEGERQYILGAIRPTFIHTYGSHSRVSLERDRRFASDYVPIHEYDKDEDPYSEGHASGIFVRRDAVSSPEGEAQLESLRRETHRRESFLRPPSPSFLRRWLEETALVPKEYRAAASARAAAPSAPRPSP